MITIRAQANCGRNSQSKQATSIIGHAAEGSRTSGLVVFDDTVERERVLTFLANYHDVQGFSASDRDQLAWHLTDDRCRFVLLASIDHTLNLDTLSWIRRHSDTPTIIVGSVCEQQCVAALERGADDYIAPIASLRELLTRIRVVLRRGAPIIKAPRKHEESCYIFCGWEYDEQLLRLTDPAHLRVGLTRNEYALLSAFLRSPQRALSRDYLIRSTRKNDNVSRRAIDNQILRLRRKLKIAGAKREFIRTQPGVGYVFDLPVERHPSRG